MATLILPLVFPAGSDLGSLLAGISDPLIKDAEAAPPEPGGEEGWQEAYFRLLEKYELLRARHHALGETENLRVVDTAYWDRNPLRLEAMVAGRDASPWRGSLLIAAGSRDGVRDGMPVTVGNAYVGTVTHVGPRFSRLRLLTDPDHRVWAAILAEERSGEGYLSGTGDDTLDMRLVRTDAGMEGDPVFTAGGTPLVPRGLYIGRVVRMEDYDRDGVATVEVAPALGSHEIRVVNILVAPEEPK